MIAAVDKELTDMVDRDKFRQRLNSMNDSYEKMSTFIDDLRGDLRSIEQFERDIKQQEGMGFDCGSSLATLQFQRSQLSTDLTFFENMKKLYLKRTYSDLYSFASEIGMSASAIEQRRDGETTEELHERKMSGAREFDQEQEYQMNDNFNILSLAESLLMELAQDIAGFTSRIGEAEARAARGFQIGSLVTTLRSQQVRLRSEFVASIAQITAFLDTNVKFAGRCLKRIETISQEIMTEEEARTAEDGGDANPVDSTE